MTTSRVGSPVSRAQQVDPHRRIRRTRHSRPCRAEISLPPELQAGFERELRGTMRITKTPREQAAATMREFAERFADLADSKREFHALIKQVYGRDCDARQAEALRQRALAGDFTWLPPIQWVDRTTLHGGHGAYNSADNVIYLAKDLISNPALAAQVYAEEAGHRLDTTLKARDSAGDEGELFRRLLAGETLSKAEISAIRAENDHGVILVDGKRVEVEFWGFLKKLGRAIAKPFKKVGSALKKIGKGIGKAVGGFFGGLARGAAGFVSNMVRGKVGSAFSSLWQGIDDAFLKAPMTLCSHALDACKDLIDAPTYVLGPIGRPLRRLIDRADSAVRSIVMGGLGVAAGAIRSVVEGSGTFLSGFGRLVRGDFKGAWRSWRDGFLQIVVKTPIDAIILGAGSAISAIQTLVWLERPGRKLSDEQIARLRAIYGESIDYDLVRIKTGKAGLFSLNDRAFVLGNTIYMKDADVDGSTLIHEMCHVWQYQNGGSDYLSEALYSQKWGKGYNWQQSVPGTPWEELEPEQQAKFIEDAYTYGAFDSSSPHYGTFWYDFRGNRGRQDLTTYLRQVQRALRLGLGAP